MLPVILPNPWLIVTQIGQFMPREETLPRMRTPVLQRAHEWTSHRCAWAAASRQRCQRLLFLFFLAFGCCGTATDGLVDYAFAYLHWIHDWWDGFFAEHYDLIAWVWDPGLDYFMKLFVDYGGIFLAYPLVIGVATCCLLLCSEPEVGTVSKLDSSPRRQAPCWACRTGLRWRRMRSKKATFAGAIPWAASRFHRLRGSQGQGQALPMVQTLEAQTSF